MLKITTSLFIFSFVFKIPVNYTEHKYNNKH